VDQERLLRCAEVGAWSVAKLREEICRSGPKRSEGRGGRKPTAPLQKTVRNLLKDLDELRGYVADVRRQQEHGGCEIALKIATVLEQARHDCSRLFSDNLVAGRTRATYCADDHETTVEESEGHARQSEHSAKPVSATWPVSETPGPNVLIVEDDALLGRSLCQVVSLHGIPLVVGTSREACALLSGSF
jgi:hypothetical protein